MGLLDDAIRDHLDLKRRHGADPADVERAEREALGPVRRAPVERSDGELELGPPDQNEELYEDEYAPEERVSDHADWADPFDAAADVRDPLAPERHEHDPFASEPFAGDHAEPPTTVHEPLAAVSPEPLAPEVPPPVEELEPDEREPAPGLFERDRHAGDETVEYDVEGALERDQKDGEESEDVLEETPEFLQDTPDHDRLWFEQKPPKDFDFDG
jgi:hypothetical protein